MLYFFLSYARSDDDVHVQQLYEDLCAEVRLLTGLRPDVQVGFLDTHSIEPGETWPDALANALAQCRSFLALCSPAYYLSEPCGKEWTIFQARCQRYREDTGTSPAALIPLLWLPTPVMPVVARNIQYATDLLSGGPVKGGVRQLLRLSRNRDAYLEFVSAMAERIVESAHRTPVPPAAESPDFHQTASAFHDAPALSLRGGQADRTIDGVPVSTASQYVYFVVAAATSAEAAGIRRDLQYYGEHPQDWAPYRPAFDRPLGDHAVRLAADRNFASAVTTVEQLTTCIERAGQHNQIVVLLVDAWSTKLDRHRHILEEYDQRNEPTTAVIIPWSPDDRETQGHRDELVERLRQTFLNNSLRHDDVMFRSSVLSHTAFGADLQTVLEVARNRVFARGTVHRRPYGGSWSSGPILEGP